MIAAHADWSVDPAKRWITLARGGLRGWMIAAPAPVGEVAALPDRLLAAAAGEPVVLGLDLPIGLPRAYAERHAAPRAGSFPRFLPLLSALPDFFRAADSIAEVGPLRPFYPARWRHG